MVDKVADLVGEPAHITLFDAGTAVTVAVATPDVPGDTQPPERLLVPGSRRPAHASASGKLFLAHSPRDLHTYLLRPLHSFTEHTITRTDALVEELQRIRRRNWSTDEQEYVLGVSCLAVPVWGARGQVAGSIVVTTQNERMQRTLRESLLSRLMPAAAELTLALGGREA